MKRAIFISLTVLFLFPEFSSAAVSPKAANPLRNPILQTAQPAELQMLAAKPKPPRPPRSRPRVSPSK